MDSVDYPPPSPFICPAIRTRRIGNRPFQTKEIGEATYLIIDNSYDISDTQDDELSHSHQLQSLYRCNNKDGKKDDLYCNACDTYKIGTIYYFCNKCGKSYHKECVESPPTFISSYHPKHPLQLLKIGSGRVRECHSCGLRLYGLLYYSPIYDLIFHPFCAKKQDYSVIKNPKRHEHILHYFPRKASLTCDVCASDENTYCFYICLQCDFVVHGTCIYLPHVILISSHNHRLSFTPSLPFANWICGVCRLKIDENYGEYSCTKGCAFAVHSKCATRHDVWDGKELEDQPEMVYENLNSFEEISEGTIRHFSHAHHYMKLIEDTERVHGEKLYCQACVLPLYDGDVYMCMQCDFALHEACANLPRITQNMLHPHRFILKPSNTGSSFYCASCNRHSCGFRYMCCESCPYNLDVRCASLSELFNHKSHPHPLFVIYERGVCQECSTCGGVQYKNLNCVECDFTLCFRCATLPHTVKHKDDEHVLTLSYEKNASDFYWCQVCEETTYPKKGYYACNECGVTFHIECILGINPYMNVGHTIETNGRTIEIIPNNRLSRPICNGCQRRCQFKIAYKTSHGNIFCTSSELLYKDYIPFVLESKIVIWIPICVLFDNP